MSYTAECHMKIGGLVPEIQAVKSFAQRQKTGYFSFDLLSQNQHLQVLTHFA